MPESALCAFGRWVSTQDWADVFSHTSISDCVLAFTAKVNSTVDLFFPLKMVPSHPNDKPWITRHMKDLILQRQQAFSPSDHSIWRLLKNEVARVIASTKQSYYTNQVSRLKSSEPSRWWKHIKQLHGKSSSYVNFTISHNGSILSDTRLPDFLNHVFVSVSDDFTPLDYRTLPAFLQAPKLLPVVSVYEVKSKLANIEVSKAAGPDRILNRVLREFPDELAYPVTDLLNRSFKAGLFPESWKQSFISPIPKTCPILSENDLRPISLTTTLSKIQEDCCKVAVWRYWQENWPSSVWFYKRLFNIPLPCWPLTQLA